MTFLSIDPASGERFREYAAWDSGRLDRALAEGAAAAGPWAGTALEDRCAHLARVAELLLERRDDLAALMQREMGKTLEEAKAEVERCAAGCRYYAEDAATLLADEIVKTDAPRSFVTYQPLGLLLAIMPWNFPCWQVIRAAAPALVAGNVMVLKHADNVTGCALALEEIIRVAGFPAGVFQTLLIPVAMIDGVIRDPRVRAVTLTGSERAGVAVGRAAGEALKKCVLELGGSDPFVVLEDADLDRAAEMGLRARYQNSGQSCICAKRFILVDTIADAFLERFRAGAQMLKLAPLARVDLRDSLHAQVEDALAKGAEAALGCMKPEGKGAFYPTSILDQVKPGMRAWDEELFGPVAIVIRVKDEAEALAVANGSDFGLGGSVWTKDLKRGEAFARRLESGMAFVNSLVRGYPHLPFGGVKRSGYGRELSRHGMHEFMNVKALSIG